MFERDGRRGQLLGSIDDVLELLARDVRDWHKWLGTLSRLLSRGQYHASVLAGLRPALSAPVLNLKSRASSVPAIPGRRTCRYIGRMWAAKSETRSSCAAAEMRTRCAAHRVGRRHGCRSPRKRALESLL
jgi:hypothetical protein